MLANMALDGLQPLLERTFRKTTRKTEGRWRLVNPKVNYVRYADDFTITGCSKELLEDQVKPLVREFLKSQGSGAIRRKDQDHARGRGIRFPWMECEEVQRQAPHQAKQGKRQGVPAEE